MKEKTKYETLRVIKELSQRHRKGPSLREIGDGLGLNGESVVLYRVRMLEKDGLLSRLPQKRRSIRLTAKGREYLAINHVPEACLKGLITHFNRLLEELRAVVGEARELGLTAGEGGVP
ncbi:MAG: hypothetical protein HQL82_17285 [Magnetococcales bacterium]|nr:hypothetical protein [Magnetococcales bacterium]